MNKLFFGSCTNTTDRVELIKTTTTLEQVALDMGELYQLAAENGSWICMFSPETWETAGENEYKFAAFTKARAKSAGRIRVGDMLFAYISKRMRIAGALVATSTCYYDETSSIFGTPGQFPYVLTCKPFCILSEEHEIRLADHFHRISIFGGLKDGKYWSVCLRNSPRDLRRRDCEYLLSLFP